MGVVPGEHVACTGLLRQSLAFQHNPTALRGSLLLACCMAAPALNPVPLRCRATTAGWGTWVWVVRLRLNLTYSHSQSNHRSWADFYLDVVATDGNAQMLSRMAVAYVFPMFMLAVCIIRSVVLFKRGEKVDHEVRPSPLRVFVFVLAVCIIRSVVFEARQAGLL